MNVQRLFSIALGFSLSVLAVQLAGCDDECSEGESPCGGQASFLKCTDFDAHHFYFQERQCVGVEPMCVDLPDSQHRCDDKRPPAHCEGMRSLNIPKLDSPGRLLHVADLDSNGRPDLLLYATLPEKGGAKTALVRVMQSSNGSFGAPIVVLPDTGAGVFAADLDGDKRVDLLQQSSRVVSARFGRPDGSFSEPAIGISTVRDILEVSDVDGDGSADLIAGDADVLVVLGPPPQLTPRATLPISILTSPPGGLSVGRASANDLDGDGRPELIAYTFDGVQVFTRSENEWVAAARFWNRVESGDYDYIADLNHDGIVDRVSVEEPWVVERPRLTTATRDAAGKLTKQQKAHRLPVFGDIWFGDFDSDGHVDILSANTFALTVLRGRGDGSLEDPQSFQPPNTLATVEAVVDIDADGSLDVISRDFEQLFVAPRACLD